MPTHHIKAEKKKEHNKGETQQHFFMQLRHFRLRSLWVTLTLFTYILGLGSGYLLWGQDLLTSDQAAQPESETSDISIIAGMVSQINPHDGFKIPAQYGDIGPKLLKSGAIDYEKFLLVYEQSGKSLSDEQVAVLENGSKEAIVIDRDNAHFLLNLFWALGLTNSNPLLEQGPMMKYSEGQIGRFASTGGWTIGVKSPTELYSSTAIISLTPEQHTLVEEVASGVYRPCCNNPTHFPDCNHGMAMLGLLQLLASQGVTAEQMFETAKYTNAFWFPQQNLDLAIFFKETQGLDFEDVDARKIVGRNFSSGSGSQAVKQWLGEAGLIERAPSQGGSCGVSS
ncbi:MAG: hypothetical protein IBX69_13015 [Anaerolineales bacterium]|nr:hypothetical protein [Anaerolineales bacterium]